MQNSSFADHNLTAQPRITKVKRVVVRIGTGIRGNTYPFEYDEEIDKSILKGLRFVPSDSGSEIGASSIQTFSTANTVFQLDATRARSVCVVLVNDRDEIVMQPYPLMGLAGVNPRRTPQPAVTPRFNTRVSIKKCYLLYTAAISVIAVPYVCVFDWYYKQVE